MSAAVNCRHCGKRLEKVKGRWRHYLTQLVACEDGRHMAQVL